MTTQTMVLEAATLSLATNDLSGYLAECEVSAEVDEKDVTTFASAGWSEVKGGLKKGGLKGKFLNDFQDNALDEIMWALLGTVVAFVVKADDAAISAANPSYSGSCLIKSWTPIKGKPGDVVEVDFDYPTSGAITRNVSA